MGAQQGSSVTAEQRVRFDEAWQRAQAWARERLAGCLDRVVLVRDLHGRVRVVLDERENVTGIPTDEQRAELAQAFAARVQGFAPAPADVFLRASQMFAPDEVFASPDALPAEGGLRTLERLVVGADWMRAPVEAGEPSVPRLTLHGIKGGVGRTTAAAVLAWRLAQSGKRVLMIDLDLESPGLGSILCDQDSHPDYGVVDWLVEDAVGQADDQLLLDMRTESPLARGGSGRLWVVPAAGRVREGYSYLPKLGRAYNDVAQLDPTTGAVTARSFVEIVAALLARLEAELRPDLTILDSRAGLHDIAALAITRLQATSLLFVVDTPQTWDAYRLLFDSWRAQPARARAVRERLRVVAALTPETRTAEYLDALRDHAYDLFLSTLYDEAGADDADAFSFDLADDEAPHSPLRVHWSRALQQFDPVRQPGSVTDEQVRSGFGDFVNDVHRLVFGESP
jgi:hypothetical protein